MKILRGGWGQQNPRLKFLELYHKAGEVQGWGWVWLGWDGLNEFWGRLGWVRFGWGRKEASKEGIKEERAKKMIERKKVSGKGRDKERREEEGKIKKKQE